MKLHIFAKVGMANLFIDAIFHLFQKLKISSCFEIKGASLQCIFSKPLDPLLQIEQMFSKFME